MENLVIGTATMVTCVVVQCVVVGVLFRLLIELDRKHVLQPTIPRTSGVLAAVLLIMVIGHVFQVILWAGVFYQRGEFGDFATACYHSTVNFTALGYGDLVMSSKHRLLGAMEAANGVLMFGLSTSMLFAVLHAMMRRAWEHRHRRTPNIDEGLDI